MRVTREQVAANREKILDSAVRLFKLRGFEAVTVAEVMKAAGLTHGGFYGYFKSKDELIAAALMHGLSHGKFPETNLIGFALSYLSPEHRDDCANGCAIAGLASEIIRQSPETRTAITAALRKQIDLFSKTAPGNTAAAKRRAAIGSWAAMVGAVILARLSNDRRLSDELLSHTRAWISERCSDTKSKH